MKGLNAVMGAGQGQPAPAGSVPAGEAAPESGGEPNVTPEEQAVYDQVVTNAYKIIYPEGEEAQVSPKIIASLKASDKPVLNLATTAVTLVTALQQSAKASGQPVPGEVLFHAATEIIEDLAEVSEAAKIHDYSEEEMENALYLGLDMYREQATKTGDIDTEQLKEGWEQVKQADASGTMDQFAPGLAQRMREGQ